MVFTSDTDDIDYARRLNSLTFLHSYVDIRLPTYTFINIVNCAIVMNLHNICIHKQLMQ